MILSLSILKYHDVLIRKLSMLEDEVNSFQHLVNIFAGEKCAKNSLYMLSGVLFYCWFKEKQLLGKPEMNSWCLEVVVLPVGRLLFVSCHVKQWIVQPIYTCLYRELLMIYTPFLSTISMICCNNYTFLRKKVLSLFYEKKKNIFLQYKVVCVKINISNRKQLRITNAQFLSK